MRKDAIIRSVEQNPIRIGEAPDRRAGPRVQTVMRVGHVAADGDEGLVLVKNLSDQGARVRIGIPVRLGEMLTLTLAEGDALEAQVIWTDGDECGLRFRQEVDCADLLSRLSGMAKRGSGRPLRLNVSKPAVIRSEAGLLLAAVEDISQNGMKIRHDGRLTRNMVVKATLPSGLECRGVVRWSHDNIAGVLLLERISHEELGSSRAL